MRYIKYDSGQNMVLMAGLEPARREAGDFKSPVSAYSTTSAWKLLY